MTETSLSLRLENHQPVPAGEALSGIDRWLAASALQKAVRRGKEGEALRCTRLLVDVDPQRLWRRIVVIAMEDVGVADINVVADTVFASRSKVWRDKHGGDWHVASYLVPRLCAATKNRDTDDLGAVAVFHPDFRQARAELACATETSLCDVLADGTQPLARRSLAALYLSGTNEWSVPELPRRRGDMGVLLDVYRHIGVPGYVSEIIEGGAKKERGALPVNLGLLWLQAAASPTRRVKDERASLTHLGEINGVSSEAYDMHTRPGKRALAYFCKACRPVRAYLSRFVSDREIYWVIVGLAWRVESSLLDRRFVYDGSEAILDMAKVANIASGDFPAERVDEAIDLMRRHLPDLHQARLRVMELPYEQ